MNEAPRRSKRVSVGSLPADCVEPFQLLWQQIAMLWTKWRFFTQLYNKGDERIALLNSTAPTFFAVLQRIMSDDLLLHIAKLLDPAKSTVKKGQRAENLSLRWLIERLEATEPQKTEPLKVKLEQIMTAYKRLKPLRDRVVSHHDLATLLNQHPEPLPQVEKDEMQHIVDLILEFLDATESAFQMGHTSWAVASINGDAEALCRRLEHGPDLEK